MRWVAEVVGGSRAGQGQAAFLAFLAFLCAAAAGLISASLGRCRAAWLASARLIRLRNRTGAHLGTVRLRAGVLRDWIPPRVVA